MTKTDPISYDVRAIHGMDLGQHAYQRADPSDRGSVAGEQGSGVRDHETHGGSVQIRVIIADDHPVVLAGVRVMLERADDLMVAGEAHSGSELINFLKRSPCDVIITDYSMPPEDPSKDDGRRHDDGLPQIKKLMKDFPSIPVIVLTMVNNVGLLRSLQNQGVLGLVDKRSLLNRSELLHAVRAVISRKPYVSQTLRERFEQSDLEAPTETTEPSPREMEVFRLFVSGMTVTQIAERLSRSVKTVSTQKRQAMKKLGLQHDRDMVAYAREHGISFEW